MTELYKRQEYIDESKRKKRMFTIWLVLLSLYVLICVTIVVSYAILPYGTSSTVFLLANIILTILFSGYSLFFFSMRYSRIRSYVKLLGYIYSGTIDTYSGWFLRFDKTLQVHEGVDYYTMVLLEFNPHKREYYERKVLIDMEKSVEYIPEHKLVKYQTQGNVLVRYQLLNAVFSGPKKSAAEIRLDKKKTV